MTNRLQQYGNKIKFSTDYDDILVMEAGVNLMNLSGQNGSNVEIKGLSNPTTDSSCANKAYVDSNVGGGVTAGDGLELKTGVLSVDASVIRTTYGEFTDPTNFIVYPRVLFQEDVVAKSYSTISDAKFKQNIQPLDSKISIDQLKPMQYELTTDPDVTRFGFIAQDLQKTYPNLVENCIIRRRPREPFKYLSVHYNDLIPLLVQELQTLKSKVRNLENTLESIQNKPN